MNNKMFTVKEEVFSETEILSSDSEAEDSDETEMFTIKSEAEVFDAEILNLKTEGEDLDETVVTLDTYNSDLNLVIDADRFSAKPLTTEGFYFMWAGARATYGASKGKFCFEVKILDHLNVGNLAADEPNRYAVRVGFSVERSAMQLGEDNLSYGYDSTGTIATNSHFHDFGESFTAGDVILGAVCVDADSEKVNIGFAKNGKFLGWAFQVEEKELKGHSLFPHVLTKNVSFEVNLGQKEQPYFPLPDTVKEFTFIGCLPLTQREGGTRAPKRKKDCEVIIMCGLPGAGKSTWAADHAANNPNKKFNIIGISNIMDKMKVMGLPHTRKINGKWGYLLHKAKICMMKLFKIGSKLKRNYILDQNYYNVYSREMRKMVLSFAGFQRKAVVVVPSVKEYQMRRDGRKCYGQKLMKRLPGRKAIGKYFREMREKFRFPEVNDIFNEVIYTDLQKGDAEMLILLYNANYSDNCKRRPSEKWIHSMFTMCLGKYRLSELNIVFNEMELQAEDKDKAVGVVHYKIATKFCKVLKKCLKGDYKFPELREIFNSVVKDARSPKKKLKTPRDSCKQYNSKGHIRNSPHHERFPPQEGFDSRNIGGEFRGGFEGSCEGFHQNGGVQSREAFHKSREGFKFKKGQGRFIPNTGGFEGSRGGFGRSRGGFESGRGGFDRNIEEFKDGQEGFDGNQDFASNQSGFAHKRNFDKESQGANNFSSGYGESPDNNFSKDFYDGRDSNYCRRQDRYFSFQRDGNRGSDNSREWYGGNIFNQDSSQDSGHRGESGCQAEGESHISLKREPDWP